MDVDKIRNSKISRTQKNETKKMSSFRKQSNRRASDVDGSICLHVASYFKSQYEAVMKTRFPLYICISVYIIICLLGNIVMAIIFWKHDESPMDQITLGDNFTAQNNLLLNIDLNESTILDSSIEFDEDFFETGDLDFYHIFINESENEVR